MVMTSDRVEHECGASAFWKTLEDPAAADPRSTRSQLWARLGTITGWDWYAQAGVTAEQLPKVPFRLELDRLPPGGRAWLDLGLTYEPGEEELNSDRGHRFAGYIEVDEVGVMSICMQASRLDGKGALTVVRVYGPAVPLAW